MNATQLRVIAYQFTVFKFIIDGFVDTSMISRACLCRGAYYQRFTQKVHSSFQLKKSLHFKVVISFFFCPIFVGLIECEETYFTVTTLSSFKTLFKVNDCFKRRITVLGMTLTLM